MTRPAASPNAVLRPARAMEMPEAGHAQGRHDRGHLGADVGHLVGRAAKRDSRIGAGAVPLATAGAAMLARGEAVETPQRADLDLDLVEQAEGEIDRHPHLVGEAAAAQERLRTLRGGARVALVAEAGRGLRHVADQDQRGLGGERIGKGGGEIGAEQEVGLGDVRHQGRGTAEPSMNTPSPSMAASIRPAS